MADKKSGHGVKSDRVALVRFPVCAFGATHLSLIGAEFMDPISHAQLCIIGSKFDTSCDFLNPQFNLAIDIKAFCTSVNESD